MQKKAIVTGVTLARQKKLGKESRKQVGRSYKANEHGKKSRLITSDYNYGKMFEKGSAAI